MIATCNKSTSRSSNKKDGDDQQQQQGAVVVPGAQSIQKDGGAAAAVVPGAQSIEHGECVPVAAMIAKKGGGGAVLVQEADCSSEVLIASATYACIPQEQAAITSASVAAAIPVATMATATPTVTTAEIIGHQCSPPSAMSFYYTHSNEEWQQECLFQPVGYHQFNHSYLQSIPEDSAYVDVSDDDEEEASICSNESPILVDVASCGQSCWEL